MGTLLFGHDESLTCIQHVELKGPSGEALCIGYKTSKYFFGAGVYLHDDGYILRMEATPTKYFKVEAAELEKWQAESLVPRPLPPYTVAWHEYAFGYSLWIIIAGCIVAWRIGEALKKRRMAEDAQTPVSLGPPQLATKIDRYVEEQVRPLLAFGESVQHQGYTLDSTPDNVMGASAFYVALTDKRIIFIKARVGAFGPLLENKGVEEIDRDRVARVVVEDRLIQLVLDDGTVRVMFVVSTSKLSNQRAFLRDIPRLLGGNTT